MAQLKKPLTKERVTALSLTFQAAMKMTIPCDLLYMFWDEACSAHMDLQDHRKESFLIYCSMLQGSEEAKIPERFQECAQVMKTVLQSHTRMGALRQRLRAFFLRQNKVVSSIFA